LTPSDQTTVTMQFVNGVIAVLDFG
jgi:hypothetical protein